MNWLPLKGTAPRRLMLIALLLAFALGTVRPPAASAALYGGELFTLEYSSGFVANQIVVKLVERNNGSTLDKINRKFKTTTIAELSGTMQMYLLRVAAGETVAAVREAMARDSRIAYSEPNVVAKLQAAPKAGYIWGVAGSSAEYIGQGALGQVQMAKPGYPSQRAHDFSTGANTKVYILDTGIYSPHPQLQSSLPADPNLMYDYVGDDPSPGDEFDGIDNDGDGVTDYAAGHGTFVAGIVHLVAPGATIVPMRVLDTEGYGNQFVIAEAIRRAADDGADVISISFYTPTSATLLQEALQYAAQQGSLVVAAASCQPHGHQRAAISRC